MSTGLTKQSASDNEFEQSFFSLSYDKLQGKLHNLLPFLVGFETVNKTDDNNKAIGVFGFKSGNGQVIYVPAFFINGKVKDMDVMYSRNNNQFYPLNEEFAELFLKDDITGLGDVADSKKEVIMRDNPPTNYRNVFYPPRTGKTSYAEAKDNMQKEGLAIDYINTFAVPVTNDKIKQTSILDFIKGAENTSKEAFWQLMSKNAEYTEALRRFYTDDLIAEALTPKMDEEKEPDVKFYNTIESVVGGELPLEKKQDIISKGYAIVDNREDKDKTKFGKIQVADKFSNPAESGFYPYVTELGAIRYGLVLVNPETLMKGFSNRGKSMVVSLEGDNKGQTYIVDRDKLYVKDQIKIEDYDKVYSMLDDLAEASPSFNDTYILVNEKLNATEPFRILMNFKDNDGIRRVQVEPERYCFDHSPCCEGNGEDNKKWQNANKYYDRKKPSKITLAITKRTGNKLETKGSMIYVPKGYKLFKIKLDQPYSMEVNPMLSESERDEKKKKHTEQENEYRASKPGALHNILQPLHEAGFRPITLNNNGSEYFVNIDAAKKKYSNPIEAKIGMVIDFGFDEKDAEELVDELIPGVPVHGTIKLAVTGQQNIPLVDESPGTNFLGQPEYNGTPYQQQVTPDETAPADPTRIGLGVMPDVQGLNHEVQKAVQLASSGQKHIFDTQSIATIAKYVDPMAKVTEYIPNFVSSLDNLGRMLFMLYWETDKFQQMYGKDELPELIELIKSVFKNLGDLVIFLKRKFPELSINNNEQANDVK